MPAIDEIAYGCVITYLTGRFQRLHEKVEAARNARDLRDPLAELNADVVFQELAIFHVPSAKAPGLKLLLEAARDVKDAAVRLGDDATRAVQPFVRTAEDFASSEAEQWVRRAQHFFVVPVTVGDPPNQRPGLVYLRPIPRGPSTRAFDLTHLSGDVHVIDDLRSVASVMVSTFYLARRVPWNALDHLSAHAYQLAFGMRIDRGRSVGAAAFAAFTIAFLEAELDGPAFASAVNIRPGTVLTGEIDPEGRMLPVEHVDEKIRLAAEQYGPDIKVIVPAEKPLDRDVARLIRPDNLHYVRDAEELLALLVSQPGDSLRGLSSARKAIFGSLTPAYKAELEQLLKANIEPNVFDRIRRGEAGLVVPRRHEGGVYALCLRRGRAVEVQLALEPSLVQAGVEQDDSGAVIFIILDGSAEMDAQWAVAESTGVSRIAALVAEIVQRCDLRRQTVQLGYLSASDLEALGPLDREPRALTQKLTSARERHGLKTRGAYFIPVMESSSRQDDGPPRRYYVLSDSPIYDLADDGGFHVTTLEVFGLTPNRGGRDRPRPCLYRSDGGLASDLLDRHFHSEQGTFAELRLSLGHELPLTWGSLSKDAPGELSRTADGTFVVTWSDLKGGRLRASLEMANEVPPAIIIEGAVRRASGSVPFRFNDHLIVGEVQERLADGRTGQLTSDELRVWQAMAEPGAACLECGKTHVHLTHPVSDRISDRLIFQSAAGLGQGWFVLEAGRDVWQHFRHGIRLDEVLLVAMEGKLYFAEAGGELVTVVPTRGVHMVRTNSGRRLYACLTQ